VKPKLFFCTIIVLLSAAGLALAQTPCDKLKSLSLQDTLVTVTEIIYGRKVWI
jgi:hypothetical protein